jgi:hypothetical protein
MLTRRLRAMVLLVGVLQIILRPTRRILAVYKATFKCRVITRQPRELAFDSCGCLVIENLRGTSIPSKCLNAKTRCDEPARHGDAASRQPYHARPRPGILQENSPHFRRTGLYEPAPVAMQERLGVKLGFTTSRETVGHSSRSGCRAGQERTEMSAAEARDQT